MIEGETPAERRKRIKAIKSGQALIILKSNPYALKEQKRPVEEENRPIKEQKRPTEVLPTGTNYSDK